MRQLANKFTALSAAIIFSAIVFSAIVTAPIHAQSSHSTAVIEGVVVGPDARPVAGRARFSAAIRRTRSARDANRFARTFPLPQSAPGFLRCACAVGRSLFGLDAQRKSPHRRASHGESKTQGRERGASCVQFAAKSKIIRGQEIISVAGRPILQLQPPALRILNHQSAHSAVPNQSES